MELETIYQDVIDGNAAAVAAGVRAALDAGAAADMVLQNALIRAMTEVGSRFEAGDFYVPEMLISARAMQSGLNVLKPALAASGVKSAGKIVIGTVKGDLHDIGKNLVGMMLEGAGYEVVDLGTDVGPEKFAGAVREHQGRRRGFVGFVDHDDAGHEIDHRSAGGSRHSRAGQGPGGRRPGDPELCHSDRRRRLCPGRVECHAPRAAIDVLAARIRDTRSARVSLAKLRFAYEVWYNAVVFFRRAPWRPSDRAASVRGQPG